MTNEEAMDFLLSKYGQADNTAEEAIGIAVRALEKQKVSGWIPIDSGPPPIGTCLILTVFDRFRQRNELRYPVYYQEHPDRRGYGFYLGDIGNPIINDVSEIIAWKPMPKPYEGE